MKLVKVPLCRHSSWSSLITHSHRHSHTQSGFIPASHCCHLPFSLSGCYSWKDLSSFHGEPLITAEWPYSTGPTYPEICLWKREAEEESWIERDLQWNIAHRWGMFSLRSSLFEFWTIWNGIAMISVFSRAVTHTIWKQTSGWTWMETNQWLKRRFKFFPHLSISFPLLIFYPYCVSVIVL